MALAVFLKAVPEQVKTNVLFFLEEVQAAPPSLNPPLALSPLLSQQAVRMSQKKALWTVI